MSVIPASPRSSRNGCAARRWRSTRDLRHRTRSCRPAWLAPLAILLACLLPAQASGGDRFAIVGKSSSDGNFVAVAQGCAAEARRRGDDCELVDMPGPANLHRQVQALRDALRSQRYRALAVSVTSSPVIGRAVADTAVPVVAFDSPFAPPEQPLAYSYVGIDNVAFGCEIDAIIERRRWDHLVCTDQRAGLLASLAALHAEETLEIDLCLDAADGSQRFAHLSAYLVATPALAAETTLFGALRDITARRASDEALRLANAVHQNSGHAIAIADAGLDIVAVNPAFTALSGYSVDDLRGRRPVGLFTDQDGHDLFAAVVDTVDSAGRWEGEAWHRRRNGDMFVSWMSLDTVRDDDNAVRHYVAMFHDITEKKRTETLIWNQANYDVLTRLPNRRLFTDRLQQDLKRARRDGSILAVFFIDLDRFKEVNDVLGHHRGDELLQEAALRIQSCVRDSDTVARLGGDEFTVMLPGLLRTADVEPTAKEILHSLSKPFQLGEQDVFVSASIGITFYPDDAENIADLLKDADQAMYAAKHGGRNRFCYYMSAMEKSSQVRMQLITALHGALEQQQFVLLYQPIVDLVSGRIVKAESLLRWRHPEHGMVSPGAFIPLAEETGIIHRLGEWVFATAIADAQRFQDLAGPDFQVGINLSPVQLRHPDRLCGQWAAQIESTRPAVSMVFEITEGVLLNAEEVVIGQMQQLQSAGVQFAIDDFGTGYSSLSYLRKFSIDYVKIDQSFTQALESTGEGHVLVEAIIVMAHKLGLQVIAEGIETAEQRSHLAAMQCDYGQGFLFSRPLPAAELAAALRSQAPRVANQR